MKKIIYTVLPRFEIRKKGKVLDFGYIEEQFRDWIKQFTDQGYVISRDTTISAIMEPGCFSRLILRQQTQFIDFAALEFQKSDQAIDYQYHIAPIFFIKVKKLSKMERKKIGKADWGFALFEKNREDFEKLINDHINRIASKGLRYNTSTVISVTVNPGCFAKLFGKKKEEIDFEAYELLKSDSPVNYLCRIFPRFKTKSLKFSFDELEKDISSKVETQLQEGYQLAGKIIFGAFMLTGCLGKGEMVKVDAFLFQKV